MSIRRYESGERIASREMIQAIATALNVDFYSLASWDQATEALIDRIDTKERIYATLEQLNDAGMEKAADAVEIIAGNPKYQCYEDPEGTDTAPGEKPPERL